VAGRPENFNGAVGSFKIEAQASPTEVVAEEPLLYRLRITSTGPVEHPPQRPDLRRLPKFPKQFHIQDLPAEDRVLDSGEGHTWEFVYRLRPRQTDVKWIPAVRFDYYKPGSMPPVKGYRATFTHPLALTVKPRVPPPSVAPAPHWMYEIAEGSAVLRHAEPPTLPSPFVLALLAVAPPLVCCGWYWSWRRLYPDAARAARRRRSLAARRALQALHSCREDNSDGQAKRAVAVLTAYLGQRLEVSLTDATPEDASAQLRQLGFSDKLADQIAELFRVCELVRFAPETAPPKDNPLTATEQVILALESETWLSPLS
jgi:hypothetical protein